MRRILKADMPCRASNIIPAKAAMNLAREVEDEEIREKMAEDKMWAEARPSKAGRFDRKV